MDKEHKYSNGDITVVWKPSLCIHAGECVKRLPQVYKPGQRPWINTDQVSSEALKDQIGHCPSAALSFIDSE